MGAGLTLREGLIRKFEFLKGEGTFFSQAFRSRDRNSVVAYDYQCILEFYTGILKRKLAVDRRLARTTSPSCCEMYCEGLHRDDGGVGDHRAWSGPFPELVDLLLEAMPARLGAAFGPALTKIPPELRDVRGPSAVPDDRAAGCFGGRHAGAEMEAAMEGPLFLPAV